MTESLRDILVNSILLSPEAKQDSRLEAVLALEDLDGYKEDPLALYAFCNVAKAVLNKGITRVPFSVEKLLEILSMDVMSLASTMGMRTEGLENVEKVAMVLQSILSAAESGIDLSNAEPPPFYVEEGYVYYDFGTES